jgi:hypothetical protein
MRKYGAIRAKETVRNQQDHVTNRIRLKKYEAAIMEELMFKKCLVVVVLVLLMAMPIPSLAGCKTKTSGVAFSSEALARAWNEAVTSDKSAKELYPYTIRFWKDKPVIWVVKPKDRREVGQVQFLGQLPFLAPDDKLFFGTDLHLWVPSYLIDCD